MLRRSLSRRAFATVRCRPSLDDVERLSYGLRAKRRGAGSRIVPHRLDWEEREAYAVAMRRGFAIVRGAGGYRRERKGTPLLNTLRQRADARARPLVWVEQVAHDTAHTCVDVSPLRDAAAAQALLGEATRVALGTDGSVVVELDAADTEQNTAEERSSLPVWALEPCVARYVCIDGGEDVRTPEKRSKRLAKRLADALGTAG